MPAPHYTIYRAAGKDKTIYKQFRGLFSVVEVSSMGGNFLVNLSQTQVSIQPLLPTWPHMGHLGVALTDRSETKLPKRIPSKNF